MNETNVAPLLRVKAEHLESREGALHHVAALERHDGHVRCHQCGACETVALLEAEIFMYVGLNFVLATIPTIPSQQKY